MTTEHPTPSHSLTMLPLILWSMDGCPFCEKARAYLTEAGIPFREMKENDKAARQRLCATYRWSMEPCTHPKG